MSRTTALVPALLVVVLVATGCGDDQPGAGGDTSSPAPVSASPSASGSATPSSSAPPSSVTPSTSSVSPATGQRFDGTAFTIAIPDGWVGGGVAKSGQVTSATFVSPDQTTLLDLFRVVDTGLTLDEAATIERGSSERRLKRRPDREIGGRTAFVFTGDDADGTTYTVGSVTDQGYGTIRLSFAPASVSGKAPDSREQVDLIESVLATVEWQE